MTNEVIDKRVALIIGLQVFLLGSKNCLISGIPFLFFINAELNKIIIIIIGSLYLYAFWITRKRRLTAQCILFWIFILFSYLLTFLLFPQNTPFILSTLLRVITIFFMTSILLSKIRDFSWLKHYMTLFSYPTIIAGGIAGFFLSLLGQSTTSTYEGDTYVMSLSYAVLIPVMWLLHEYFKSKRLISLLFALIGVIIILLYGSRNPLLAIGLYVVIEVFYAIKSSKNKAQRMFFRFCLCMLAISIVFYKQVIKILLDISISFGFNSRTLQLLSADEIDVSNRDLIHRDAWNLINENPIIGLGVQGDIANMGEMAHNLYLSIFCSYGYVIGGLLVIFLCKICVLALIRSKGLDHQILVMYICLVFPRSFTGGDIWTSDILWWLLAFAFVLNSKKYKYQSFISGKISN